MSTTRQRLERLLGDPSLVELRSRLRRRFERGAAADAFTLDRLADHERTALEGLLGRSSRLSSSMRMSLAELNEALARAGIAESLRDALEQLDGPIRDIALEEAAAAARWDEVFALREPQALADLVAHNQGRGLLKRLAGADPERGATLLAEAARVLATLPAAGIPLSRLAAQSLGDSHALDESRPVATLLLAALRLETEERARETWARLGVLVAELASPVLTFNLPVTSGDSFSQLVLSAAEAVQPLHLSLRTLSRGTPSWSVAGRAIFVCENPAVVAMAADRLGRRCAPIVCTDGMPAAAQRTLLMQLSASGASLFYHGDFDWAGLAIGNYVMRSYGAKPWRFGSCDYCGEAGFILTGAPVPADWDAALSPAMSRAGRGMHEEAVIEELLGDLAL